MRGWGEHEERGSLLGLGWEMPWSPQGSPGATSQVRALLRLSEPRVRGAAARADLPGLALWRRQHRLQVPGRILLLTAPKLLTQHLPPRTPAPRAGRGVTAAGSQKLGAAGPPAGRGHLGSSGKEQGNELRGWRLAREHVSPSVPGGLCVGPPACTHTCTRTSSSCGLGKGPGTGVAARQLWCWRGTCSPSWGLWQSLAVPRRPQRAECSVLLPPAGT